LQSRRVLLIEDDAGVRATISSMLRRAGYEVVEAVNGFDGMDALRTESVHLVLTDLIMPEQEGIETIRQIREITSDLPIIAMSGWNSRQFSPLDDALAMGADRALQKPFQMDELMTVVRELIR
jgi:DNA-binding response OmpR family regulator